jgi:hypothetical protein
MNLGSLSLTTSYTNTISVPASATQITISSNMVLSGGYFMLGGTVTLTVQGQMRLDGGGFDLGPGGAVLRLSQSGIVVSKNSSFNSYGSGAVAIHAIDPANRFPFNILSGYSYFNNTVQTQFHNSAGLFISSAAYVTANNLTFTNTNPNPSPAIVFTAPSAPQPVQYYFNGLSFDVNVSTNIDATTLIFGSSVSVVNSTGSRMGSVYEKDPQNAVNWYPDGGSAATISGTLTNGGGGSGLYYIGVMSALANAAGGPQAIVDAASLAVTVSTGAGAFTLSNLSAPNTYYLYAWRTSSANQKPSGFDPRGGYGYPSSQGWVSSPLYVGAGASVSGVNINLSYQLAS